MNYGFIYKATLPNKKVVLEYSSDNSVYAGPEGFDPSI